MTGDEYLAAGRGSDPERARGEADLERDFERREDFALGDLLYKHIITLKIKLR